MRIRQVDTRIHCDEHYLERTPLAKHVFLYLLTHPRLTTLGVVAAGPESIAGMLTGTSSERVRTPQVAEALAELDGAGMLMVVQTPEAAAWFPKFLRYQRWNPKVAQSWPRLLAEIPNVQMRQRVRQSAIDHIARMGWQPVEGLQELK